MQIRSRQIRRIIKGQYAGHVRKDVSHLIARVGFLQRRTATLASGTWLIHVASRMRIISGPAQVNVPPNSAVSANYVLDSGIRVPVPQQ